MLRITFKTNPQVIDLLHRKRGRVIEVLQSKLTRLMFALGKYIQEEKLSGQVLHPRSGRLRGSVTAVPATISGTQISAAVESSGGPAFYGAITEHGILSPYEIIATKQRFLKFLGADGKEHFTKSVSRKPMLPKPFMAQSLIENKAAILAGLEESLRDLMKEP